MSLNLQLKFYRVLVQATLAFACVLGPVAPTLAQDATKPAAEKWRPKEGTYASPGKGFADACGEFGDLIVELREKDISGHEWSCKVTKLTDTGPGAIKLAMTCYDYNLAEFIKKPEETKFEEVMLLKKIDERSMLVRKTLDGKFKDPEWRAAYCPEDAQRMYVEATAKSKAEAKQKAAEEKSGLRGWHPRDGLYASPGADFSDRCLKSGDAIIGLAQNSVSSGTASCYVSNVADAPPYAVKLGVICNQSGAQGLVMRTVNGQTTLEPAGAETMIVRKIDDQTVFLQKSQNGQFSEAGQRLSYCPEAAQRSYVDSKKTK